MQGANSINENDRSLAHGLRLHRTVRIGARFIEQHECIFSEPPRATVASAQHVQNVFRRHAGIDPLVHVPDCRERHVIRGLHQSELSRGFDEPARADEVVSRHHVAPRAHCLADIVGNE